MDVDSHGWLVYYERLKRDFQDRKRLSNNIPLNEARELLDRIVDLEKDLNVMKESPMQYDLWGSEIIRRQVILENMRRMVNVSCGGESKPMVPSSAASSMGTSSVTSSANTTVINPLTTTDRGLVQRQKEVMKMQDDMILDIEKGVDRIHQTALEIGKEVKVQSKLLDQLDTHVDEATEGLREETRHAESIGRKGQVCYMYICICVEVIILVILILIFFVKI